LEAGVVITRNLVVDVLSACAAYDSRTVGESDVAAWSAVLANHAPENVAGEDLLAAVVAFYAEPRPRRAMVGDILALAKERAKTRAAMRQAMALQQMLESAPMSATGNMSQQVRQLVDGLRRSLRPNPDGLRRAETLRWDRQRGQAAERRQADPSGLGFCVSCWRGGRYALATDPVRGSTCVDHAGGPPQGQPASSSTSLT